MDSSQFKFTGISNSVMETYTSLLVPRLFIPWARYLLEHCDLQPGKAVLDIACGPGTVTHLAAERIGKNGRVTAADISPEMIALAKQRAPSGNAAAIEYVETPAAPLNVADEQFDIVLCQQGLQFFPDKVAAIKEMKRATRPGGKIALAVWLDLEDCPLWQCLYESLKATVPSDVAEMIRGPFSLNQKEVLHQLCSDAGLPNAEVTRHQLPLTFEGGPEQVPDALKATPLGPKIAELDAATQQALNEKIVNSAQAFKQGDAVETHATSHIIIVKK